MDYPTDGKTTLKVPLKNIEADCTSVAYKSPCIEIKAGAYGVEIDVVGTKSLTRGNSACIFYEAAKAMTISGSGTLNLNNSKSVDGSIWARGGDLLPKNTKVNFKITNSTVTVSKKSSSSGPTEEYALFGPAPEFVDQHTAIAGLLKNAENPEKL